MGVVDRLARKVVAESIGLEPDSIRSRVEELLPEEAPLVGPEVAAAVVDTLIGLGPLEPLLRDPGISDVLVNGDGAVWVERGGILLETDTRFAGPDSLLAAIRRVISPLGLRLDRASPAVDARLPDGSRLHAIIPPAAVDGPVLAVRRFTEVVATLDDLLAQEGIDRNGAELLRSFIVERRNLLVCGPTGSGKTTLLNVLSHEIPPADRVVSVEDAAELRLGGHVVRLEGQAANSEGLGAITMRQLLRHALRLRPDRIIVGEVRGAEAFDMLQAMSTGHDGSMSTIHARSATEALWRLETLALVGEGSVTEASVRRQVRSAIDVVVVVGRRGGRRRVASVVEVGTSLEEVYQCSF